MQAEYVIKFEPVRILIVFIISVAKKNRFISNSPGLLSDLFRKLLVYFKKPGVSLKTDFIPEFKSSFFMFLQLYLYYTV